MNIFNITLKHQSYIDYTDIIDMGADKEFYYGEIPKEDFRELLLKIQGTGGKASDLIRRYCQATKNPYFLEYAVSDKRGLAISLFGDLEGKRVLDYGCGLGSMGIEAIKKGAIVTFADSSWDRLEMARHLVSEVSELSRHRFIAVSDIKKMSDLNIAYDLIIINGLLEWLPSAGKTGYTGAHDAQIAFLRECKRLLKSNGRIFIGMENRYAFIYQIGYPEDHTKITGLSIMDRAVANMRHKCIKGDDFVNLTWSYLDYYRNALILGMDVEKIFGMFPDYRFPQKTIDLNNCDSGTLIKCMLLERIIYAPVENYTEYLEYLGAIDALKHYVFSYGVILKNKE
jgi:SAM-dependent methyltransferase